MIVAAILLLPAFFSRASIIDDLKKKIGDKEIELQELEKKAAAYKDSISQNKKEQKTLKGKIDVLTGQINYLETQIQITKTKADQANLLIEKLKLEIEKQIEAIETNKIYIASVIQKINEFDKISALEIIINNSGFSNIFNQNQHIETLQEEIQKNIDDIQLLKFKLESQQIEQEEKEAELEELKDDLSSKKNIVNSQKEEKKYILNKTKNQEKQYSALLSDVQRKREAIQKEVYELEEKLKYTIDPATIPVARPGLFDWPTQGRLTQKWGSTSETGFINDAYKFHNGIDIASSIGTPIYSAGDGKVAATGNNGQYAYGKWVAIDHENGLITLYAHLSLQSVTNGSVIKKGQRIGYMGSTGFSTGSHLHFTVYAKNTFQTTSRWFGLLPLGASINPFDYLTQ